MKKIQYSGVLGLFVVFSALQLFRPLKNSGEAEGKQSIVSKYEIPPSVRTVLRRACYDCHSNNTNYPWYANVQPLGWWMNKHIIEGRAELNLSNFAEYDSKRAVRKLQAVADEVRERHMPPKSYLLMHDQARMTEDEVSQVANWAENLADNLENR